MSNVDNPTYYGDYVQLDKLLNAQHPLSNINGVPAHDEMLFIIAHQTYELWFKQILHEIDSIIEVMQGPYLNDRHTPLVVSRLERVNVILKVLLQQIDILETMTPMDFLEFRDALIPASGFQSYQFRLLECKLGYPHNETSAFLNRLLPDDQAIIKTAMAGPNLLGIISEWLERMPFMEHQDFSFWEAYRKALQDLFERDRQQLIAHEQLTHIQRNDQLEKLNKAGQQFEQLLDENAYQQLLDSGERRLSYRASCASLFILLYRDYPIFQLPHKLLSTLIDLDDLLTNWRYRHFNLAMRMIGPKIGTGGSAGAGYLRETIHQRVFSDLTSLSTFMISRSALPPLPAAYAELLGFHYTEKKHA